jgi:uncharacterized protein YqjF (DUF2071 family)
MYQRWENLLFLHWKFDAVEIQRTLPDGLFVDTHEGHAYMGVVPFFMCQIRPRFLPAVPGLSNFLELNLRTYVYDRNGVPGVWFYSLDANQWLAVKLARTLFHLPYEHATMQAAVSNAGATRYRSHRTHQGQNALDCEYEYAAGAAMGEPQVGSLEFFLIERYHLYSVKNGALFRGTVAHQPYALHEPILTAWDAHLFTLDGFAAPTRPPDHCVMSRGVDVRIFPLRSISNCKPARSR